ncbi:type II toxin-antitoxin system VapC family toxin [Methylibium sp.]|uniref:type II toxin-antitoxin system VapC family toxin n=1 Tax=Methylibium sp. TaxID=2067992 RepID=UPI0018515255|nr:type II toxin-antitoxin system VapC family toxin [Methylibium sp.]MBA3588121.1 type II toxin-antitoxin system VapC family toxin [Methylibium sp.]
MRILLDTHILLWALDSPHRLPASVRDDLADPANDVLFSSASIWEIAIKAAQGRHDFKARPALTWRGAIEAGFEELPVRSTDAIAVLDLPVLHKDPFDRLLLAQAIVCPAWLYTADRQLESYPGPVHYIQL